MRSSSPALAPGLAEIEFEPEGGARGGEEEMGVEEQEEEEEREVGESCIRNRSANQGPWLKPCGFKMPRAPQDAKSKYGLLAQS